MAIHPGFIRYSTVLHPLVLDAFFFIAAAAALLRYRHEPTLRRGLIAAAVIGFGALTRPTILIFLVPLCWLSRRVPRAAVLSVVALAILAPWTIRNALVHHTFMLTRSGGGFVFWLGHNPANAGSVVDVEGRPLIEKPPMELRMRLAGADEVERDRIFREEAWKFIRANPLAAIGRIVRRVYYFWWFTPQWGQSWLPIARLVYRAWWTFLVVLIAIGWVASRNRDLWLLATLALLISIVQSVYYVEGRHRLAVEPLVIPFAAAGLTSLWPRRSRSST
jgi:hypothetical protein